MANAYTPTSETRTVAICGGYTATDDSDLYRFAYDLGVLLARGGFEVLNGGYDGTMVAACKGARDAGGRTIGITCPSELRSARGAISPNLFLDEEYPAPDILARINVIMRLSGGYVFLDGGTGTLSELGLTWEFVS